MIHSKALSRAAGCRIWLKLENTQPVGSFKLRGLFHLCQHLTNNGVSHFVSSSGGNAGYTVAYIAKAFNLKATVFVPETTPKIFVEAIQGLNAEVRLQGRVWDESNLLAQSFAKQHSNRGFVPPFDHPKIWEGHASMVDEIAKKLKPKAIITAVGGAGLLSGLAHGLEQQNWQDVKLIGVETTGAASFHETFKAKELVTLAEVSSIAKTLSAKTVTIKVLDWMEKLSLASLVVSDEICVDACLRFADDHRFLVEPACGAPLAACYQGLIDGEPNDDMIVIVCGGIGVNLMMITQHFGLN